MLCRSIDISESRRKLEILKMQKRCKSWQLGFCVGSSKEFGVLECGLLVVPWLQNFSWIDYAKVRAPLEDQG